jgi:hypothetical protein
MTVMSNIFADLAKFFINIHKTAQSSGLEHEAIEVIKGQAEQALSHINQHSQGLVNAALEVAAQTGEGALQGLGVKK